MRTRLKANSRTASIPEAEIRISEMDSNGVLVSRPGKKIEYISMPVPKASEVEPQVWNLTRDGPVLQSKATSVSGINKMKAIHDFIRSNGRIRER